MAIAILIVGIIAGLITIFSEFFEISLSSLKIRLRRGKGISEHLRGSMAIVATLLCALVALAALAGWIP